MNWLTTTLGTSIGKKLMMAVTGLSFLGFLAVHLAGNLTLYGGADTFNSYAEHLHALGILLNIAEFGLLFLFVVHVLCGLLLFWQNYRARPVGYAVSRNPGGKTIGSASMPYTGLFILAFIVFHLMNFSFVDKTGTTIFQIVSTSFQNPVYVGLYILAMIIVALHVSHGFWTLFQPFGLNHPKPRPAITATGLVISVVFGLGFGFLPIYIAFIV
ncbi:MAG: succinate dehydrogenase cytochrome b subunit [Desulfosarcina sp.]|nr:succinate dehydrogenase cytochrome b subunit [Desulfobacterales bacterium]